MKQYLDLLKHITNNGESTTDRTGTGTKAIFGYQMRFNLADGFPIPTTKKVPMRIIIEELLWFLRGDTSLQPLLKVNVNIWNEWPFKRFLQLNNIPLPVVNSPEWKSKMKEFTDKILSDDDFSKKYSDLGPIYGRQWRSWETTDGRHIDQLQQVIDTLSNSPDSRRMIVTAWNPGDIEEMAKAGLPPCHCLFQFKAINGKLSLLLYQRSCDTFLGVPFNIASYALLLMMVAQVTGLKAHEFIWTGGDVHLYDNHVNQVAEQVSRIPRKLPTMTINPNVTRLDEFTLDDFTITNYDPDGPIKAPIAV